MYAFWYGLVHASPLQRSVAMGQVLEEQWRRELEQIAEEAIGMAAIVQLDREKAEAFVAYVGQLAPQRAEELLAVMYLGRGDERDFAAMRQVTVGFGSNPQALAGMMLGKGPLVAYLQKGLTKFKLEDPSR